MAPELDRRVSRDLSYGLYIVTSRGDDRLNGQIVNTVVQVTSDPARAAVISNLFPCFSPLPLLASIWQNFNRYPKNVDK